MSKLTAKQEVFAQSIADGNDQATAYRTAYDAQSMKDETVYSNASRLMNNSKVVARVKSLKALTADKQLWTREMSVKGLMSAYKLAQQQGQASGMTGAVKELNIMHGFNAPSELSIANRTFIFSVQRAGVDE